MATDDIGARIRKRRQELGMTQKQLADKVGVHVSSVISWEKGTHFPVRFQGAIEAVLGISLDEEPRLPPLVAANSDLWQVPHIYNQLAAFSEAERVGLVVFWLRENHPERLAGSALPAA